MKKRFLQFGMTAKAVMIALLLGVAGKTYAYDFSAVCETGQTLYYNIIDAENHYVELTYPGEYSNPFNPWPNSDEKPIGIIVLPSIVRYNDNDYLVSSIGQYAFYNCNGLTGSLIIPNSVSTISSSAFSGCSGFNGNLVIPNSVTTIGGGFFHGAFQGCNGFIGDLCIPNSVETIESYAFFQCSGFSGSLIIPNSVTTIGEGAFRECSGFDGSLTLPNTLVTINRTTFQDCSGFTGSLSIPNTVTSIGGYAFYNCSNFNGTLNLSDSLTIIGEVAFRNCCGFAGSLIIPNAVTSIGNRAFHSCYGFDGIILSNSVTSIGEDCFNNCWGFTGSLIIPNSVIEIGQGSFRYCNGLVSATIGNSLTSINESLFDGCTNLSSITIGKSVESIGNYFAYNCRSLNTVTVLSVEIPVLAYSAFPFSVNSNYVMYVPYESLEDYKTTTNWSFYAHKMQPISHTTISAHSENGGWHFIASPLAENTAPTEIDDMIPTTGTYDLYRFDQTENAEWRNYKADNFNLVNGQGYLYANAEDVNLIFKGSFNEDETKNVGLVYDANANFAGWNLVGNPFPVSAYANKSFYTMNEDGSAIEPVAVSMETAIPACTGVMVKAENTGESVTFSKTAPETQGQNNGSLQIAVAQTNTRGASTSSAAILDKAVVSFNEGDELGKFVFNKDNAKLYIPQGNEDYAIACAEKQGEMPLNFKATENGEYTISIKAENAEFDYLHLIDNLTGTDIDLLPLGKGGKEDFQPATYTFTAKTTDYASRFRLLFSVSGDAASDNGAPFAFINNGSIIVSDANADATLQIVDMAGHIIVSADVARNISTKGMAQGVYVLRLIKGDEVKTQRIVIE